ncbi:hypothetical protein ACF1BS_03145 [Streptomyces sp. NPDC014748]|uniref:hypothetical protein n=1 Tax=Streptomyces sp. NPDC014748 TaxID=3364905 RepID=UPI0037006262
MPAISVGSVEVDVIPSTQGIYQRLKQGLVPAATRAGDDAGKAAGRAFGPAMQGAVSNSVGTRIGQQIGQQIAAQIAAQVRQALQNGVTRGGQAARPAATRQGEETGGAFARSLRARLEAAFRSMPKLDVRLSDTGVDADLARLRARLEALAGKRIGIDVDAETARAEVADIEERLRRLGAAHPNVAVRADTAAAIAQLQAMREEIDRLTADPARIRVETDGQLGTRLRAAVREAEASLPNVNIGADTGPAQAEIASLRAQLTALRDSRIGIDVDAATALARITEIQARLARLSAQDADIAVRVDAGAAAAQLAAFQAAVNRLDGQSVSVDTSSSVSGMQVLVTAALTFGPAIIPVLPVVAAGLGAIAAAATAAAAGLGGIALVAVPAFKQIAGVLQAQKAAQDAAANSSLQGGQAASQAAQRALQQASAAQSLATAQRNAARQIADAQRGITDAERQAAQANIQAAQQVKAARQSLTDAYEQAADRMKQANSEVSSAERDLTTAQKASKQAQIDLTQARKDAAQQLEDLNNRLADAQLSQRDAEIALKEATAQRDAVLKNANATELDKQKALLAYDQAVQRLKEQTTETGRLKDETAAANKAGVDGSKTVLDAQERAAQAQQEVTDRTQALKDAQAAAAKAQIQNTRAIVEAQEKLSQAQANVAETQRSGAEAVQVAQERLAAAQQSAADSIASAQRQIASASLSAAGGVDQAAIAQAKYREELAKLTPSARGTYNAFVNLKGAFSAWSRSLQPQVMPIFTRALDGIRRMLPTLTPFVIAAADAVSDLQDRFSRQIKSPFWQRFKDDLQKSVKPAIIGLGVAVGNIFAGIAGIIDAFLPHMDGISSRMQRITGKFADWGKSLKGSPEFERFLTFSSEKAPLLGDAFGKIGGALLAIGEALAPVSGPMLQFLGGLAHAVDIIATNVPWLVVGIWGAVVAFRWWTLALAAFNFVASLNPIVQIGLAVVALIALVVYAYNRFGWFRTAVQAAWAGIQTAALLAWNTVLKPVLSFLWSALQTVGQWAMWLWNTAIGPAFRFIWEAAKILLTIVVVLVLLPIIAVFKLVAATAMWLWNTAISPVFHWIGSLATWLYDKAIKPAFNFVVAAFQLAGRIGMWLWKNVLSPAFHGIGDVAMWLYNKAIKPAFNFIASVVQSAWQNGIRPVFDTMKKAIGLVGKAFDAAKDAIKLAWDKVEGIARKPVAFVVNTVYGKGIRPTWNTVAKAFGAPQLPEMKFASGGVMPGYTPGRDVHRFLSPTGGALELSGGEAIMRPEFTRAVGSGFVGAMNHIAKSRGSQGVKAALAPMLGGNPDLPTDRSLKYAAGGVVQRFADGGIFGWIKSAGAAVAGAGSKAWNVMKKGASWLGDTIEASARAGVKHVVDPLLRGFPGMSTGFGQMIRRVPTKVIDALFGYSKEADKRGGGGLGGPRIQAALNWAKTQAGKPYQWAGNGDPSWDCSGFMSAIESVIRGQKPHRRWATMAFNGRTAPPGWVYHGNSPFKIGITNAGVGHTAGTLGRTNVESRGGAGVVVGTGARGYNDRLFPDWYGFEPGKYDIGGWMPPGMNLMYNGLGQPEAVLTPGQWNAIHGAATRGGDGAQQPVVVELLANEDGLGRFVDVRIQEHDQQLVQVINAS